MKHDRAKRAAVAEAAVAEATGVVGVAAEEVEGVAVLAAGDTSPPRRDALFCPTNLRPMQIWSGRP
jgi:hypothetical protein